MSATTRIKWLSRRLGDVPSHNRWLSPIEKVTLGRTRLLKRRADWRLGRWTAKCAVSEFLEVDRMSDIAVVPGDDGAPRVFLRGQAAPVQLSLSHSHGIGLCVVGNANIDIGCDAELIEERGDAFITDFFTSAEQALILTAPRHNRPLMATLLWSAKESVLKAVKTGLREDARAVNVRFEQGEDGDWSRFSALLVRDHMPFTGWWRTVGNHVFTVAQRKRRRPENRIDGAEKRPAVVAP